MTRFDKMSKQERTAAAKKGGSSPKKKPAGFAAMPLEKRREVARKGGLKSAEVRHNAMINSNGQSKRKV